MMPSVSLALPARRMGGFASLLEAAAYARHFTDPRLHYFDSRGELERCLSYAELWQQACGLAQRLQRQPQAVAGARVGLVATTSPAFLASFIACQALGLVPCPLPVRLPLQDVADYQRHLQALLHAAGAGLLMGPAHVLQALVGWPTQQAQPARRDGLPGLLAYEEGLACTPAPARMPGQEAGAPAADAVAYVQFSSGSTAQPKGIAVSHGALMRHLDQILHHGMALTEADRAFSWLPYYHDMGLVGFVLAPLCAQVPVDYLAPAAFARRPWLWPALMAGRRSTITYAPASAYALAARHVARSAVCAGWPPDGLAALRIAGVGGDVVRAGPLRAFAEALAPHGFRAQALRPSYGLAEATLAVAMVQAGVQQRAAGEPQAGPEVAELPWSTGADGQAAGADAVVASGTVLPWCELTIRDAAGRCLSVGEEGDIHISGPCLLSGVYQDGVFTARPAGAPLATGDVGHLSPGGRLYVTGRKKELIIVNGRNVWPQDVELRIHEATGVAIDDVLVLQQPADAQALIAVLVHEKALRQSGQARRLAAIAAAAVAATGCRVQAVPVPNGSIAKTTSGKKARVPTATRFLRGEIPMIETHSL